MSPLLRYLLLLTVLGTFVASCELLNRTDDALDAGLEGRVLAGPQCPVVIEGRPCPDKPFRATFEVFDNQEERVTTFQSDDDGYFKVSLLPGIYKIIPDASAPIINPRIQVKEVTVQAHHFTQVTLLFDTGIR
ncbi:MAG: hypothetical protein ACE5G0_09250 [Rhodothermales bacterium]